MVVRCERCIFHESRWHMHQNIDLFLLQSHTITTQPEHNWYLYNTNIFYSSVTELVYIPFPVTYTPLVYFLHFIFLPLYLSFLLLFYQYDLRMLFQTARRLRHHKAQGNTQRLGRLRIYKIWWEKERNLWKSAELVGRYLVWFLWGRFD